METNKDPYEVVKKRLPLNAKLGFVFDLPEDKKYVVYYENHWKPVEALYCAKENTLRNPTMQSGMMDDGLRVDNFIGQVYVPKNLLINQYKTMTVSDLVLLELLADQAFGQATIARGIEVVCVSSGTNFRRNFDKPIWDLGDAIITVLREYPVLTGPKGSQDVSIDVDNVEVVLTTLVDLITDAPPSKLSRKIVSNTWATIQNNIGLIKSHRGLAPLYQKVCDLSRDYVMGV